MDERRLEELFRSAVPPAPEASFDRDDVLRGSRRVTARRRVAAGGAAVTVAVALLGGAGAGWFASQSSGPTIAGDARPPVERGGDPPPEPSGPGVLAEPRTGGADCGSPDAGLAADVRSRLPQSGEAQSGEARPVAWQPCPDGAVTAALPVRQDERAGTVAVVVAPADALPQERSTPGDSLLPDGGRQSVRPAGEGRAVVVTSTADNGGQPPYAARVPELAGELAGEY
ncbi:hypothetical protein [Bounagaea algeriensis]